MADDLKKTSGGRPKGAKSKLGIPSKSLSDVAGIIKILYENYGNQVISAYEIRETLNLPKMSASPLIGILKEYGLIKAEGNQWVISDLGKRIAEGDREAMLESLKLNSIFKNLINNYGDKDVSPGVIITFLRNNYRKGENALEIAKRYLETMEFISQSNKSKNVVLEDKSEGDISKWIKVIQLDFAVNPIKDYSKLLDDVITELKTDKDPIINSLAQSLSENKDKPEVLKALIDNLAKIAHQKYPKIIIYEVEKKT